VNVTGTDGLLKLWIWELTLTLEIIVDNLEILVPKYPFPLTTTQQLDNCQCHSLSTTHTAHY